MSLKEMKKTHSKNFDIEQLQKNVSDFNSQLVSNPVLDGLLLENVKLTSGTNSINHGLGRAYRGYFIVRSNADVSVYDTNNSPAPTKVLILTATATATVSIYIF